jgi:hypothetical protein
VKVCSKCKIPQELSEFYIDLRRKDGKSSGCRTCHRKACYKYWLNNREKTDAATKKWQQEHRDVVLKNVKAWQKRNPKKRKEIFQRWFNKNPEKAREMFCGYAKNRRETIKGNLINRIGPSISESLHGNKKGRSWESIVGYTVEDLKRHLEKHFSPGMSWDNRSEWDIDHKIPISAFNFERYDDVDFKRCWDLENLRPLWKFDNRSKKDRLYMPFQPSLLVSIGG